MGQGDHSSGLFDHSLALWIRVGPGTSELWHECTRSAADGTPILSSCRTVICSPLPQQLGPQMPDLHPQRSAPRPPHLLPERTAHLSTRAPAELPTWSNTAASEEPFHYPLPAPRLTAFCCWPGLAWTSSDQGMNMPRVRLPRLCPRPNPGICGSGDSRPPSFFCAASFSHPMRPTQEQSGRKE